VKLLASRLLRDRDGSVTLEAALLLPFFLAFVLGLVTFIQLAITELALQSAVSEAVKVTATQLYPARLLVQEGKAKVEQSKAASVVSSAVSRVQAARDKVIGAEDFIEDYSAYIPDFVLEILRWEKETRENGEQMAIERYKRFWGNEIHPRINAAFQPLVSGLGNERILKKDRLSITSVLLPSLDTTDQPFFSIEAAYEFRLMLPFFHHTFTLKKRAYERCWIGA
jgi:hypothetical protein